MYKYLSKLPLICDLSMKNQYTPSIAHFSNTLSAKNSSISTVFIVLAFGLVFVPFANKRDAISVKYYTGLIGLQPVISNEDTLFPAGASIHLVITTFSDGSREIYNVEQRNRIMVNSAGFSKESSAKFIFNTSYIEVNGYLSPTQTIKLYENVPLKEDPIKQEEGYFIAGKNYYNRGDYVKAVENFNNAIAYNSKNGEYYNWLGDALYKLEKYDEAIINYVKCVELNQKDDDAYWNLGNCYNKKLDKENAKKYWKISMDLGNKKAKKNYEWILTNL